MLVVEVVFKEHVFEADLVVGEAHVYFRFPFAVLHLGSETHVGDGESVLELRLLRCGVDCAVEEYAACGVDFELWLVVLGHGCIRAAEKRGGGDEYGRLHS